MQVKLRKLLLEFQFSAYEWGTCVCAKWRNERCLKEERGSYSGGLICEVCEACWPLNLPTPNTQKSLFCILGLLNDAHNMRVIRFARHCKTQWATKFGTGWMVLDARFILEGFSRSLIFTALLSNRTGGYTPQWRTQVKRSAPLRLVRDERSTRLVSGTFRAGEKKCRVEYISRRWPT